jgi:CspA family cold shock protein
MRGAGSRQVQRQHNSRQPAGAAFRAVAGLFREDVMIGTVKWFDATKGYGFIRRDDGQGDVFVHGTALERSDLSDLVTGARVAFDLVTGRNGKPAADNLKVAT